MYFETSGAGWRRVRLAWRAAGVLAAVLDRARQGRKITLALMKCSDLQADLAWGYVDRAAARGQDSGPDGDRPSEGQAEGPTHERMPQQHAHAIE